MDSNSPAAHRSSQAGAAGRIGLRLGPVHHVHCSILLPPGEDNLNNRGAAGQVPARAASVPGLPLEDLLAQAAQPRGGYLTLILELGLEIVRTPEPPGQARSPGDRP